MQTPPLPLCRSDTKITELLSATLFIKKVYDSVLTADFNTITEAKNLLPLMLFYFLISISYFCLYTATSINSCDFKKKKFYNQAMWKMALREDFVDAFLLRSTSRLSSNSSAPLQQKK